MRRLLVSFAVLTMVFAGAATVPRSADAIVPGAVGRIVFWSDRDNLSGELYTRDFVGGAWQRLTSNSATDWDPAWSPDGSMIAYASNAAGTFDVWVTTANGDSQKNVTNSASDDDEPTWSMDGSRIAYVSTDFGSSDTDIWVMDADGSDKTNLNPLTTGTLNSNPAWSPDGTAIAFDSSRSGSTDIWVMSVNGKRATNLTESTAFDNSPAWSPDGSQIAFLSDRGGGPSLYVMDANGLNVRRLATGTAAVHAPAWSPDARHILFNSKEDGDFDLWMVDPDGSNLGHLTDHPGSEWFGAWESVNRPPVAAPDGRFFVRPGGGLHSFSVLDNDVDPDGEALVARLESAPSHASSFLLSDDGTFVYWHDGSDTGSDSFAYAAVDERGGASNTIVVAIEVGSLHPVGLVDSSTGHWLLQNPVVGEIGFFYGNPGDYPFVGDWDCDGADTPGLYRQSDGFAYLRNSITQGVADRTFFFGDPGDVPLAGDFNGDGCDTLSIYRPSEARFHIINELGKDGGGLGAADYSFLFGDPGDKPVVGDWDGDGVDEIGLHRESTGFFYYRNTLSTGVADGEFFFGDPGDRFVAGDWGIVDGRDTPGLFRPSDLTFYFRHTLTQGVADDQFTWIGAEPSWLPVAGDFGL